MSNKKLSSPLGEAKVPLLLRNEDEEEQQEEQTLTRKVLIESKKLWHIVGPAIFSRIASYSMLVITQIFAGHLGDLELAAISIANNVIVGFDFGLLLGMASALETLCGQAFGAKQYHMLGVYMQRSWIVLFICCIFLLPIYLFATPVLRVLGQPEDLAVLSGEVAMWMIPLHFAFAFQFPLNRFLQSQLKTAATKLLPNMRSIWSAAILLPSLLAGVGAQNQTWRNLVKVQRNAFYPLDLVDKLEEDTMTKVEAYMNAKVAAGKNNGCTLANAGVRREWGDMTDEQRSDFINATLCLMKAPSKAPKDQFPGARTRMDDFVAYHMTNAGSLHDTLGLFPAHKYFILAYETALRNECGYKGYHPYMNYDRYTKDPEKSALFNGNATSMSGNGAPDPKYTGFRSGTGQISSGGGGGCVTSGPFVDYRINIGPGSPMMPNVPKNPDRNGGGYNPRCMRRDVNAKVAMGATADRSYKLITESKDINTFYNTLLTPPPNRTDPYNWGIHTSGHYISGGDPGGDPMCSPGDPIFYFHHAMLDRLWWIWQMQDPDKRVNAQVSLGGGGASNRKIDLKWLIPDVIPVLEAHDALGGHKGAFCHVYV